MYVLLTRAQIGCINCNIYVPENRAVPNKEGDLKVPGQLHEKECKFYRPPMKMIDAGQQAKYTEYIRELMMVVRQAEGEGRILVTGKKIIAAECVALGTRKEENILVSIRCRKSTCRFVPCVLQRANHQLVHECAATAETAIAATAMDEH